MKELKKYVSFKNCPWSSFDEKSHEEKNIKSFKCILLSCFLCGENKKTVRSYHYKKKKKSL